MREPPSTPASSRWSQATHRGRLGRGAANLTSVVATMFIVGSVFAVGFAAGSEHGGDHHRGGNDHSRSEGGHHDVDASRGRLDVGGEFGGGG